MRIQKSRFGQGLGKVSSLASCGEAGKAACEFPSRVNPAYFPVRDFFIFYRGSLTCFAAGENSKAIEALSGLCVRSWRRALRVGSRASVWSARLAAAMEGYPPQAPTR